MNVDRIRSVFICMRSLYELMLMECSYDIIDLLLVIWNMFSLYLYFSPFIVLILYIYFFLF